MKTLSIQVGMPKIVHYEGKEVSTGIFKSPVAGPVKVRFTNLEGDGQADLRVHGGREKAVYAYGFDLYADWKRIRPNDSFVFGAMGENLTLDALPEEDIYVGDTFKIGTAVLQACQPRFPCFKLGVMYADPEILGQFMRLNRPGVYFRVLEEGVIEAGNRFELTDKESVEVSIQEIFELKRPAADDLERIHEILKVKALTTNWRQKLESWVS